MKVLKILGGLILVLVLLIGAALIWAFQMANSRYRKDWTAHDATFPIPFPLDSAEIGALARGRVAMGAAAKDPLSGVDLEALAREGAVRRGEHLVQTRLLCYGCHN